MDRQKLIERLMATFLGELEEHVRALNRDLLALEKDGGEGRIELLQTLFRSAHSLKGAARSVNAQPIEAACHRLESILGAARDGLRPLTSELIQLLFTTADALEEAGARLRERRDLNGAPIEQLLPQLEAAAQGRGGLAPRAAHTQSHAPARAVETATASAPQAPAALPVQSAQDGLVRVPAEKLDALLARSGELLVARRRVAARQAELELLHESVRRLGAEWLRVDEPLRRLLRSNGAARDPRRNGVRKPRDETGHAPLLSKRAVLALDRTRERWKKLERDVEQLAVKLEADSRILEQVAAPLDDEIRRMRMLPFRDACEGLERAVRDLAQASAKEVELWVEGAEVELDRALIEGLRAPLLHLVRNAVDHGIESPEERLAKGKPRRGRVTVAAALRGEGVEVVVEDDGRGVDLARVREQAEQRQIAVPSDPREAARLILTPGFSTAQTITELSGRGVGLDVVQHRVRALHGHVDFSFEPDRGTRFSLLVPLTLTTIRALLLRACGQTFALPATSVRRLVRADSDELRAIEGREVLVSDGAPVPVITLAQALGMESAAPDASAGKLSLVVAHAGETQVALAVDELVDEHEVVVKGLGVRLRRVRNLAGATVLATGQIALILNASELVQSALARARGPALAPALARESAAIRKRVLVVDDSVTTRSLERNILEAAGYEVSVAVDGADAWQQLQQRAADLVVADVEMPRMDGFALCAAIRASKRLRELPVILVTALESDADKARGLEAGADAYLPKGTFDQRELLEAIAQLL